MLDQYFLPFKILRCKKKTLKIEIFLFFVSLTSGREKTTQNLKCLNENKWKQKNENMELDFKDQVAALAVHKLKNLSKTRQREPER